MIGARLHDKANFPPHRYYANQFARFWISWAAGYPIADTQSGFRVYPAAVLAKLTRADVSWGRFVFESEILIAAGERGMRSVAVPIPGIYPPARAAQPLPPGRRHRRASSPWSRAGSSAAACIPPGLWRSLNLPVAIEVAPDPAPEAGQGNLSANP